MAGATSRARGLALLRAADAAAIDTELMGSPGFSIDQLMELAGLAVATAVHKQYESGSPLRITVLCGPGNNGGDGLVAARHLHHFGHRPTVVYPKRGSSDEARRLFGNLVSQLEALGVPVSSDADAVTAASLRSGTDVVVDALFGFSFRPPARAPFDELIRAVVEASEGEEGVRVVSVDVPSGSSVDDGDPEGRGVAPGCLVSLTAPKPCASLLPRGVSQWLGGRFVPRELASRHGIDGYASLYAGCEQVARLDRDAMPW